MSHKAIRFCTLQELDLDLMGVTTAATPEPDDPRHRVCRLCKKRQPLSEFYQSDLEHGRLRCKTCENDRSFDRYQKKAHWGPEEGDVFPALPPDASREEKVARLARINAAALREERAELRAREERKKLAAERKQATERRKWAAMGRRLGKDFPATNG